MTHEERLKEYVEKDKIYQEYKNEKTPTDFDRFCFVHCEDIEWALGEIKHLRELQKSMDKQYEELEKENQQLKEENKSLRDRIKNIKRIRKKQTQKKRKYKELLTNMQNSLTNKNDVLDEIREYIDRKRRNFIFSYGVGNEFIREYDDLLQILDKVSKDEQL